MNIFYVPDIINARILTEEESLHCCKVLRLTEGTSILITDGRGWFHEATILSSHPKRTAVEITHSYQQPRQWDFVLHLAIAPTKNMDRMEWLVEKAVEIGIDTISFLKTRYSERKDIKIDRIEKIAISAMKQSQKAYLPVVNAMQPIDTFLSLPHTGTLGIAHCYKEEERTLWKEQVTKNKSKEITLMIGPEGDFSSEEVAHACKQGFQSITLGDARLRTETAALVGCMTPHLLLNRE